MAIEVKKVGTKAIQELRHRVLWPHLEGPEQCTIEPDSHPDTFHMAAVRDNKVVGTSTLIVDCNEAFSEMVQYRLRAMATDPEVRGEGIGAKIIAAVEKELRARQIKLVWCDARLTATGFYEKLGFKTKGQIYEVPKIGPHKLMYKTV